MTYFTAKNQYATDAASTASPQRLLVMLYDRLALDLERGELAIHRGDPSGAHDALVHAQDIVLELRVTLDIEIWPAGKQLAMVYDYLLELLVDAHMRKDSGPVATCRDLVAPIHDAWHQAAGLGALGVHAA